MYFGNGALHVLFCRMWCVLLSLCEAGGVDRGRGDGGICSGGASPSMALELILQPRPDPALHAAAGEPGQRAEQP